MPSQNRRDDQAPQQSLAVQKSKSELTHGASVRRSFAHKEALPKPSIRAAATAVHRRLAPIVQVLLGFCTLAGFVLSVLGLLLAFGHTQLVASLLVGAVLCVVFGTPLLCVLGIILFYIWAMTRIRRRPSHPSQQTTTVPRTAPMVTEVILDE